MKVRHIKRRAQVMQRRGIAYRLFNESLRRFAEQLSKNPFGMLAKPGRFAEMVTVFMSFCEEKPVEVPNVS